MTTFDKVKELSKKEKISIVELEEKLGLGRNSLYSWKKKVPNGANLSKVADFFGVSVDYLLGRTDQKHYYDLNSKDKLDIGEEVDRMLDGLESEGEANFYGEPMTNEDKEKLRIAMQAALEAAQIEARKKFTPKKYRK